MTPDATDSEQAWLDGQQADDSSNGCVISFNYAFERHHLILDDVTRAKFIATQALVHSSVPGDELTAYERYKETIAREQSLWSAGAEVTVERPLVMVKHGRTIYREQWSFVSALPEDPDDVTVTSAVGGGGIGMSESREHRALRLGTVIETHLWEGPGGDPVRARINAALISAGLGELALEEAGSWNSYKQYHDGTVTVGYTPIWWVTNAAELKSELRRLEKTGGYNGAMAAVESLGLSGATEGPYYVVEVPSGDNISPGVHKPTVLCGGYPDNFCAVSPRDVPGKTARLKTGDIGLIEAVMIPVRPPRDRILDAWPAPEYLGTIGVSIPIANTARIKERLKVEVTSDGG
jgi:hypothetical protein